MNEINYYLKKNVISTYEQILGFYNNQTDNILIYLYEIKKGNKENTLLFLGHGN